MDTKLSTYRSSYGMGDECPIILTETHIEQHILRATDGPTVFRSVSLADVYTALPSKGNTTSANILYYPGEGRTIHVDITIHKNGTLSIGCRHFTIKATKVIFAAMNVRRQVGLKLKARAAAAWRR
jgi:hypothetical protein